jgi:hypothetical protein
MGVFDDELRRACLRRLSREWGCFNYWYLGEKLRPPAFELEADGSRLGCWHAATRTISVSERHVRESPWEAVLETLKHEMAHQYVDEVLRLDEALPHGEAFRRAQKLLAVDVAPAAALDQDGEGAARLRKIRRLLALGESPNRHEAEAALAKANELLLKYNIELAATEAERQYCHRVVGVPTGRRSRYVMILAGLLAEHFFVETIWVDSFDARIGKAGHVLELCGTPENVDLAEYAYHELLRGAHELWEQHKRTSGILSDRERRPYVEGVLTGFGAKLREQRETHERRHELVWLGDPGLDAFFRTRHPRLRSERFSTSSGSDAFGAGVSAGAALRLTRALRSAGADRGRMITG